MDIDESQLTMPDGSPIPEGPEGDAIRQQIKAEMMYVLTCIQFIDLMSCFIDK